MCWKIRKLGLLQFILFFLCRSCLNVSGQVLDDFSDGEFLNDPVWVGDTVDFEVNASLQLHLAASGTDSSSLVTSSQLIDSTEWSFWIRLSFSPSSNNYARVYLVSDQPDLGNAVNGYYLQFGEAGSLDAPELFRQEGNQRTSVCRGPDGMLASSFSLRVKVTRDLNGNWSVYADTSGGGIWYLMASGQDTTFHSASWFGFLCHYTSSNATKFYFDEVEVKSWVVDHQAPVFQTLTVENDHSLKLVYNETLHPDSVSQIGHYFVDQGIGNPVQAYPDPGNPKILVLVFNTAFQEELSYQLSVTGVSDLNGNTSLPGEYSFEYWHPHFNDLVINEIMADPEPQVGLPPFEYLELFNRTQHMVKLDGWKLRIGSATKYLDGGSCQPGGYLILADSSASLFFSSFGDFLGFSSFTLSNEGTTLILENEAGQVIHTVAYDVDWYGNALKAEGGWSLEQIDPDNPCAGGGNWTASLAARGGTPGSVNSVDESRPDESGPFPERISVRDAKTLMVFFSEPLDSLSLLSPGLMRIAPGGMEPQRVTPVAPSYDRAEVVLPFLMIKDSVYELVFADTLKDCAGNLSPESFSLPFGLPGLPLSGEVVINEVMFEPEDTKPEFVELYNASGKIFDLKDLFFKEVDTLGGFDGNLCCCSPEGRLFFPGEYLALTTDAAVLRDQYPSSPASAILDMTSLPQLNNEGGCLACCRWSGAATDTAVFLTGMHYPLLVTTRGVSLERLSPDLPGTDHQNWHSAAASCGFATPGLKNSQFIGPTDTIAEIDLDPPVFSPDNDGYQDVEIVSCHMNEPGYMANIVIYNVAGQEVRYLVNECLMGNQETFIWDGTDNLGRLAGIGMYVVFFEFFKPDGEVKRQKKVAVLGRKL